MALTSIFAFPIGIGAAVYLEEYAPINRWTRLLKTNIANLAGVPSVVYGLLGLGVFVDLLGFGRTLISGALTLALLILPVVIIASQEAIRAVPPSLREAAFALGATKWQVARDHVIPARDLWYFDGHYSLDLSGGRGNGAPCCCLVRRRTSLSIPPGFSVITWCFPSRYTGLHNGLSRTSGISRRQELSFFSSFFSS